MMYPRRGGPFDRVIDATAARALDRSLIEDHGIPGIVLMEHAALGVARIALASAREHGLDRVVVACGRGNNGGDGWAIARLLRDRVEVAVVSTGSPREGSDAAINARIAERLDIEVIDAATPDAVEATAPRLEGALLVDALLGTGLDRPVEGPLATLVERMNERATPIVAVDLPSGLDDRTGRPTGRCIRATTTATMVAPKPGMLLPHASEWIGDLEVVDIGAPVDVVRRFTRPVEPDGSGYPDERTAES